MESDGSYIPALLPRMARDRHLTYTSPLFVDMTKTKSIIDQEGNDISIVSHETDKVLIGNIPIMVKSEYCNLQGKDEKGLQELGECPYDEGGYFIINGSEKVIVAQERMASNLVYIHQSSKNKTTKHIAEIRSMAENSHRVTGSIFVKFHTPKGQDISGPALRVTIPYINQEIPIVILFRALGFVADKVILEHICYDFEDKPMLELLRPSLREAIVIQHQEVALDFIGKRGMTVGATRDKRIRYAQNILIKHFLPHVSQSVGESIDFPLVFRPSFVGFCFFSLTLFFFCVCLDVVLHCR